MTLDKIAKQLNVSENTLLRWKKQIIGKIRNTDLSKIKHYSTRICLNLVKILLKSIKTTWHLVKKLGKHVCTPCLKFLIYSKIVKIYEEEISKEKRKMLETKSKGLTPEIIREIEESVLGINYKE